MVVKSGKIFNPDGTLSGTGKKSSKNNDKYTYIGIALDRSGSMEYMVDPTIRGFNEHLQSIKDNASKGGHTKVSLVTFGGDVTKEFMNLTPSRIRELTKSSYKPLGSTPMYDAIGVLLRDLEEYDRSDYGNIGFLIIIISDGEENASRHYNNVRIATEIARLKATGRWTFAYIGANQDVYEVAQYFKISAIPWTYSPDGTEKIYRCMSASTVNYLGSREDGNTAVGDYFTLSTSTAADSVKITTTTEGEKEEGKISYS